MKQPSVRRWLQVGGAVALAAMAAAAWLPRTASSEEISASRERAGASGARARAAGVVRRAVRVAVAPWGGRDGEVGHEVPVEGAPQGPMSFAVDEAGAVHVLDTVNGRVVVLAEGRAARSVPMPSDTLDDLDLLPDGGYVVLDRHRAKAVHWVTAQGRERWRVDVGGEAIEHPGLATAMFARPDGVWVEIEHRRLVRVADAQGAPDERRPVVAGRFTVDASGVLAAGREGASAWVDAVSPSLQRRRWAELPFELPVAMLTGLEPQADGGAIVGAVLHRDEDRAPFATLEVRHVLVGVGPDGAERWRCEVPIDEGPEENLRSVRLGRDGAAYVMVFTRKGAEFWRVAS